MVSFLFEDSLISGHGGCDEITTLATVPSNGIRTMGSHTSTVSRPWVSTPPREESKSLIFHPHVI
jgi:hypothetical protein